MTPATFFILALVVLAIGLAVRHMLKNPSSCGCESGCDGCAGCGSAQTEQ